MRRLIEAEWLDSLPPEEVLAKGSRRDLERINSWMRNARFMAGALNEVEGLGEWQSLVDLGAGDGRFMLRVARALGGDWRGTSLCLLDRQATVSDAVCQGFQDLGWRLTVVQADALEWLTNATDGIWSAVTANLFLHHFCEATLRQFLQRIAGHSEVFVAVEPERSRWALLLSRLVGCIGCNRVTRHDAPISVRAGFTGRELSALWPADGNWTVREHSVGLLGHLFMARRKESGRAWGAASR